MKNEKMKVMAGRIDRVSKVVQALTLIAMTVCVILMIVVMVKGPEMLADFDSCQIGIVKFVFTDAYKPDMEGFKDAIFSSLVDIFACLSIGLYGLNTFRDLLVPMKDGLPFDKRVPKDLKKLGWTVIAGGFVVQVLSFLGELVMARSYFISDLVNKEIVSHISFDYSIDVTFVLIGILIFFLGYIFEYGAVLQQESDETL